MTPRSWTLDSLRAQIERLLRVEESRKLGVYQATFQAAELADLNYWLELFLAAGIATLGLVQNSTAVIIGAMLVSPLMGPILATGLALALGDFYLGLKAILNLVASVAAAVTFAAALVWALPFQAVTPEILARTQPNLLDLGVAVLSGLAGSVVSCRGGAGGGVTALPGVAIAVALMPPLCVVGFGAGSGFEWTIVRGGGLLFLTNLIAIVAASFLTFFVVRMDAPETRARINAWLEEQEREEALYRVLEHTAFRALLGQVGSLPRRALILALFLAAIFLPLRRGLEQVREETAVRNVARAEIRRALGPESVVSQRVEIGPPVRIQIVATEAVTADRRDQLQREISRRTGKPVELSIQEVARREDLLALGRKLETGPVSVPELESARRQILQALEPALAGAWPASSAPLADYSLVLHPRGLQLQVAYLADEPIGQAGEEAIQRAVETRAGARLDFVFERLEPRRNLLRVGRHPSAAEAPLAELAQLLQRRPGLSCRVMVPQRVGAPVSDALRRELDRLGASRVRVESSPDPDPWVYAAFEVRQP